jgi:hypothetical protein
LYGLEYGTACCIDVIVAYLGSLERSPLQSSGTIVVVAIMSDSIPMVNHTTTSTRGSTITDLVGIELVGIVQVMCEEAFCVATIGSIHTICCEGKFSTGATKTAISY